MTHFRKLSYLTAAACALMLTAATPAVGIAVAAGTTTDETSTAPGVGVRGANHNPLMPDTAGTCAAYGSGSACYWTFSGNDSEAPVHVMPGSGPVYAYNTWPDPGNEPPFIELEAFANGNECSASPEDIAPGTQAALCTSQPAGADIVVVEVGNGGSGDDVELCFAKSC